MGRFVEDRFEAEFVVEQPVERVWKALEAERRPDGSWWMPAFESPATELEVEAPVRLRVRKDAEPCKGTEIAVALESVETGTRVLVVQSGFPAWVKGSLESFTIGGNQIIADLVLYLERGVRAGRHVMPWAFAGFAAREVATGLEVTGTVPSCFAEKAGLRAGDVLITLAGAPVFTHLGLEAMLRLLRAGQEVEATWVRGRELQRGVAPL